MQRGNSSGWGSGGDRTDRWLDGKKVLIAARDQLLMLVGSRVGIQFDTIRKDWTLVWTGEMEQCGLLLRDALALYESG